MKKKNHSFKEINFFGSKYNALQIMSTANRYDDEGAVDKCAVSCRLVYNSEQQNLTPSQQQGYTVVVSLNANEIPKEIHLDEFVKPVVEKLNAISDLKIELVA